MTSVPDPPPAAPRVDEPPFVDRGGGRGADEALVLDIGDGIGALMLFTPESLVGCELEVAPATDDGVEPRRTHTLIRRRRVGDREVFAGVYPELAAGRWHLFGLDDEILGTIEIESGRVTEFRIGACP